MSEQSEHSIEVKLHPKDVETLHSVKPGEKARVQLDLSPEDLEELRTRKRLLADRKEKYFGVGVIKFSQ